MKSHETTVVMNRKAVSDALARVLAIAKNQHRRAELGGAGKRELPQFAASLQ